MNQKFTVLPGITYIHKKDHRDKTPEKSQWTIFEAEERSCFVHGIKNNWNTPQKFVSWGLHFNDQGKVAYLGETASKEPESQELFFAKFIDSSENNCWHGYPANHRKQQDRPPGKVLISWREKGYLSKKQTTNIQKGHKCKL